MAMDKALDSPQIVENYSRKMTSDRSSLAQLLIVDKLRKELVENVYPGKCWPKVNLDKVSNEEIAKAIERKNLNEDLSDQFDSFEGNYLESFEEEVELDQHLINVTALALDPLAFESTEVSTKMKTNRRKRLDPDGTKRFPCTSEVCVRNHHLKTWSRESGGDGSSDNHFTTKCVFIQETGKYQCQVCWKQFSTEICGTAHYNHTHLNSDCPNCGKQFTRRCEMLRHRKEAHLEQRNYECHLCGKKFKRLEHLKRHQQRCIIGRDCPEDSNGADLLKSSSEEVPSEPIVNLITVFKTE